MFDLNGKKALVTGATQGIGLEIAKVLSQHGATVFAAGASNMEKCKKACEEIGGAIPVVADLTKSDAPDVLYNATGDVDILILCASIQYKRKWNEFTEEEFDIQMDCNVKSSYFLIKKYSPAMIDNKWGRIVTIGSVNQFNNHPELVLYGASKVAQMKIVRNIAASLAPHGVTVNNISPGAIATPRNQEVLSDPETRKIVENKIACGYVGTPKDVAPAVLLMCSDEGRYITGADLLIDGGMSL